MPEFPSEGKECESRRYPNPGYSRSLGFTSQILGSGYLFTTRATLQRATTISRTTIVPYNFKGVVVSISWLKYSVLSVLMIRLIKY